ncbi:MAG: hypothetical protein WKG00_34190 [Polyangiaceae bacterium]
MTNRLYAWASTIALGVAALPGCGAAPESEDGLDDPEEEVGVVEDELLGFSVAPALHYELNRINNTPTGHNVVSKARQRGLHTIKVGPLPNNLVGLYSSNGVITIESPNNVYTFQRLAHELLHAAGYHPHYFPDKGLIGKMCNQANAACPSWN